MNREISPYLLLHADQPVDWFPWGEEAFKKARAEDKPIFLSIGYSACHWCHVMARESFEDPEVATFLNEHFLPIKVDREERPDVDHIYMNSVILLTGSGGWPLSVFLTPQGLPFWGGTYFPPEPRYGMPGFLGVLKAIHKTWMEERKKVLEAAGEILGHMLRQRDGIREREERAIEPGLTSRALENLALDFDSRHGGWGPAPRFPHSMVLEFLLVHYGYSGNEKALEMATGSLEAMARGGIYDQVGGGFHRYSVDEKWLVPHFEKMLYDNALLAGVYLMASEITGEELFRQIGEETLTYVIKELGHPDGGFFSSQWAESDGKEGAYYLWSEDELKGALGVDSERFFQAYGLHFPQGLEGGIITFKGSPDERKSLEPVRKRLLAHRQGRHSPPRDDKILASWNGLMLSTLSTAGRVLGEEWRERAERCASFLSSEMTLKDGSLYHEWREGTPKIPGFLSDYTHLSQGLLDLYLLTGENQWLQRAQSLMNRAREIFQDPSWGFFDTSHQHEPLIMRPKEVQDNAVPCGNSKAAHALLQLGRQGRDQALAGAAMGMLRPMGELAVTHPLGFGEWLVVMEEAIGSGGQENTQEV